MGKKALLMILDGWGEGKKDHSNVIYTQGAPFIDSLRAKYPMSNIVAVDYDPGASEVNQLNRIKLMLSTAFKNLETEEV